MAGSGNGRSKKHATGKDAVVDANICEVEINLRDYVQVVIKRRILIIGIFLIAVAAAAIHSWLLPEVYRASASIMLMPSMARSFLDPGTTKIGTHIEPKLAISIPTHISLLKSNTVLEMVIGRLKSESKWGEVSTPEGLLSKLRIENAGATNVLQLAAEDEDPGFARDIANIWADEYAKYNLEMLTGEVKGSGDFVERQFKLVSGDLVKAEQAAKDFDVKERLSFMEIELKENVSQFEAHDANVYKLDFALQEKKNELIKVDADIAAMTQDGMWLGAFNVTELGQKHFADEALSNDQDALRQKTLKAKLGLENDIKKRSDFVNDSRIMLLRAEAERKMEDLVTDKARLAQIKQLSESTKVNLSSKANLEAMQNLQSPIAESLPELTIWEILSLTEGYNFFETRGQSLASKLERQEKELQSLEKILLADDDTLRILDENLSRAQANYDFYHDLLKGVQGRKNSLEVEIARVEFEFSYSKSMVGKLEDQVKTLKVAVNEKNARHTELTRQVDIAEKAYEALASKIEEARIARAMELGEVKVVSTAFEPQNPVAQDGWRNIAFAGVASLMLGVFVAFCLEFWQKSEHV